MLKLHPACTCAPARFVAILLQGPGKMPVKYWRPGRRGGAGAPLGFAPPSASSSRDGASHHGSGALPRSHLVSKCLELWSWGLLSATAMQAICEAAVLDGVAHEQ
eukprot:4988313-Alexandrium_andersonii.AAC.1